MAFETLKQALTQAPILAYPHFTLEFTLATNVSDHGLGCVVGQVQNGDEVVIAYGRRKLLPAQKNYSVTEREALAVVARIKHYQHYLYGAHFKVLTDHSAVRWLMSLKMPCRRLARWALLLQQYDFTAPVLAMATQILYPIAVMTQLLPLLTTLGFKQTKFITCNDKTPP